MDETIHVPVMPHQVLEALRVRSGDTVVDATLGGGGHALLIFERILPNGRLFAFDADREAILRFENRIRHNPLFAEALRDGRITLLSARSSDIGTMLRERGVSGVNAAFADLGLSSDQLGDVSRGFSFLREGPLDMRFDRSYGETAGDIVNRRSERELSDIFREYGDVRHAAALAHAVVLRREKKAFRTTTDLADCIRHNSRDRHASIHPATLVFQALRMAVNREREALESFVRESIDLLEVGGRVAVLSFHSGEDRTVKRIFSEDARGCVCPREFPVCRCGRKARLRIVTKRAGVPSEEERLENPRARSAKLRVAERL